MNFGSDDFFLGDDAEQIVRYANALELFKEIKNSKAMGIVLNNTGNIHMKH